jgi:hypothetical protein
VVCRVVHDRCGSPFILETESNLYQLSYLSLPIHTSAKAARARGRVHLVGYRTPEPIQCMLMGGFHFGPQTAVTDVNTGKLMNLSRIVGYVTLHEFLQLLSVGSAYTSLHILWDVMPHSLLCYAGNYCLRLQGRRVSQALVASLLVL